MKTRIDYPPKLEINPVFLSGLDDLAADKINELNAEIDEIIGEYDDLCAIITRLRLNSKLTSSFSVWFWTYWNECRLSRVRSKQKWLRYWLSIYEKATNTKIMPDKSSDPFYRQVETAREKLIEDYYEGQLKQFNNRLQGLCPFHEEKTPSFFIFPNNHYHCFGCSAHGDIISFIMNLKNLSFKEAVKYLND